MGCECDKPEEKNDEVRADENEVHDLELKDDYLLGNNNNNLSSMSNSGKPKDSFSRYIFDQINALRENPQSYIDIIENAKKNVTTDKSGVTVYKTSVKVALNKGISAFDDAIETLRKTVPMKKLKYNPDFTVDAPKNEVDVKSKEYLRNQVKLKIDAGIDVKSFWKDIVKDSESCFILTVVDDSGKNAGSKRNDILNSDNKYIGISSVWIGKSFACYIVLG
jgi:hypothetical protein